MESWCNVVSYACEVKSNCLLEQSENMLQSKNDVQKLVQASKIDFFKSLFQKNPRNNI